MRDAQCACIIWVSLLKENRKKILGHGSVYRKFLVEKFKNKKSRYLNFVQLSNAYISSQEQDFRELPKPRAILRPCTCQSNTLKPSPGGPHPIRLQFRSQELLLLLSVSLLLQGVSQLLVSIPSGGKSLFGVRKGQKQKQNDKILAQGTRTRPIPSVLKL